MRPWLPQASSPIRDAQHVQWGVSSFASIFNKRSNKGLSGLLNIKYSFATWLPDIGLAAAESLLAHSIYGI